MLKDLLESKGIKVSKTRVAKSVATLQYEQRRHDAVDRLNPSPYIALYFGHKLHLDQNEKLKMFGVTHIVARDSYSVKIVAFSIMPVKNNVVIYDSGYKLLYYITTNFKPCTGIAFIVGLQFPLTAYGTRYVQIMAESCTWLSSFRSTLDKCMDLPVLSLCSVKSTEVRSMIAEAIMCFHTWVVLRTPTFLWRELP